MMQTLPVLLNQNTSKNKIYIYIYGESLGTPGKFVLINIKEKLRNDGKSLKDKLILGKVEYKVLCRVPKLHYFFPVTLKM